MKKQIRTRVYLFAGNGILLCAGFLFFAYIGFSSLRQISYAQTTANLRTFALALRQLAVRTPGLDTAGGAYGTFDDFVKQLAAADPSFRISVIDGTGKILGDSDLNAQTLENHRLRPEIAAALDGNEGTDIRRSVSAGRMTIYYAVPLEYGGKSYAIRLSVPEETTVFFSSPVTVQSAYAACAVLAAVLILSAALSSRILRPLKALGTAAARYEQGDFSCRPGVTNPREFADLGNKLGKMAEKLALHIKNIRVQQEETEAVLAGMNEALLVLDSSLRMIKYNGAAAALFGLSEKLTGQPLIQCIRNTEIADFAKAAAEGSSPAAGTAAEVREDAHFLLVRCSRISAADTRFRYILVFTDITRLKNLERVRRDFAANVSHELKTPVTAIQGFIETLLDGALEDPPTARRFLGIMSQQSSRMTNIIEDLLTISRLEQDTDGRFPAVRMEQGNIQDIFRHVQVMCGGAAAEKEISLNFTCGEGLRGRMNAGLVEQAVANLVENAVKYSPAGSSVCVTAEKRPDSDETHSSGDRSRIVITVRDDGPGIPPVHRERIFERFYRIDKGRSRETGGTGLGLSIVRHIAIVHGGTVRLAPSEKGACFVFEIPFSGGTE